MLTGDPRDGISYPTFTLTKDFKIITFKHVVAGKSLSNDVTPWSDITPCNKIDKPLVVYISKTLRNDVYYNAAHKIAKLSRYHAKMRFLSNL